MSDNKTKLQQGPSDIMEEVIGMLDFITLAIPAINQSGIEPDESDDLGLYCILTFVRKRAFEAQQGMKPQA